MNKRPKLLNIISAGATLIANFLPLSIWDNGHYALLQIK